MRLAFALLILAAALFAAALYIQQLELLAPPTNRDAPSTPATNPRSTAPSSPAPIGTDAPVAQAPLFRAAPAPTLQTPASGESFSLVGLAGAADQRFALLRDDADGRVSSLRIGDQAGTWRLSEIEGRCAVLTRRRERRALCGP